MGLKNPVAKIGTLRYSVGMRTTGMLLVVTVCAVACNSVAPGPRHREPIGEGGASSSVTSADASSTSGGGEGGYGGTDSTTVAATASASSVSASSSTGIAPPECGIGSDCPGADGQCHQRTCFNSICGIHFSAAGTELADPLIGDCKTNVCDGAGAVAEVPLMSDVPFASECNTGSCSPGPVVSAIATGTLCSTGLCKSGDCLPYIPVQCVTAGGGSIGGCGVYQPPGTIITWQVGGDQHQCKGPGFGQADYCAPGTACNLYIGITKYTGACVPVP